MQHPRAEFRRITLIWRESEVDVLWNIMQDSLLERHADSLIPWDYSGIRRLLFALARSNSPIEIGMIVCMIARHELIHDIDVNGSAKIFI